MSTASERCHRHGPFEVRLNDDGSIDEILMYIDGKCVLHLEQMDDSYYWMGLYADGWEAMINVGAKNPRAKALLNAECVRTEDAATYSYGFDQ